MREIISVSQISTEAGLLEPASGNEPLSQKEGLSRLYSFLYQQTDFSEVGTFLLDISSKNPTLASRDNPLYIFYLGGSTEYLTFAVQSEVAEKGGSLLVKPMGLQIGKAPYFWLDFYEYSQTENPLPFTGCRLRPERSSRKTDFPRWHCVGEQLLVDYLTQENGIAFGDLVPIDLYVKRKIALASYRLAGIKDKGLSLSMYENMLFTDGDRLRLISRQDEHEVYSWLDVVKVVNDQDIEGSPTIASYRLLLEKHSLTAKGWYGSEKQPLLDFLSGNENIAFENLKPVYFTAQNWDAVNLGAIDGRQIAFYLPQNVFEFGERGILVPKQDIARRYQWLELYKADPVTAQPIGECLSSGRLFNGRIYQKEWLGPDRQLLKEYTEKQVSFGDLKPLFIDVGEGRDLIHLWREKNKRTYLVLSQGFGLKKGDQLTLIPEEETEQGAVFLLKKDDIALARYTLDLSKQQFIIVENISLNEGKYLEYDSQANNFTENEGRHWLTKAAALKKLCVASGTLDELLEEVGTMLYKQSGISRQLLLYCEEDLLANAQTKNITSFEHWIEIALNFLPDTTATVFRDNEGDWLSRNGLETVLRNKGVGEVSLGRLLKRIKTKKVRATTGRQINVFNLQELQALPELQDKLKLPHVDKGINVYVDYEGEWTELSHISDKYGIPRKTLESKNFLEKVGKKSVIRGGKKIFFYKSDELDNLPEFQDFLGNYRKTLESRQSQDQKKPKIEWLKMSEEQRIIFIEEEVRKFLKAGGELKQYSFGAFHLYWLVSAIYQYYPEKMDGLRRRFEAYQQERRQVVSSKEANEYLRDLVFGKDKNDQ